MDCEQIARDELVEKYLNGQLEPPLERDLQVHILECPKCLVLLETYEDIRDDLAPRAAAIQQKSVFWNLARLGPSWRTAAIAGVACLILVAAVIGVRNGWFSGSKRSGETAGLHGSSTPAGQGSEAAFPEIAALPPAEQPEVWKAINGRSISFPSDLADLRGKAGTLMGEPPAHTTFRAVEPVGEVVMDLRPIFRWQSLAGAVSYSVAIFDTKANPIQASPAAGFTQWQPAHPLQGGQVYQWQVTAVMRDGSSVITPSFPSPKAKFRVMDQAKADELNQFHQAHPEAHLVLGILYAEAGLLKNAESELSKIAAGSRDFDLAQQFLHSVREARQAR